MLVYSVYLSLLTDVFSGTQSKNIFTNEKNRETEFSLLIGIKVLNFCKDENLLYRCFLKSQYENNSYRKTNMDAQVHPVNER